MVKSKLKEKWCPECGEFSPEKQFTAFRCKQCCKVKGKPTKLPKFLLEHYKAVK